MILELSIVLFILVVVLAIFIIGILSKGMVDAHYAQEEIIMPKQKPKPVLFIQDEIKVSITPDGRILKMLVVENNEYKLATYALFGDLSNSSKKNA